MYLFLACCIFICYTNSVKLLLYVRLYCVLLPYRPYCLSLRLLALLTFLNETRQQFYVPLPLPIVLQAVTGRADNDYLHHVQSSLQHYSSSSAVVIIFT